MEEQTRQDNPAQANTGSLAAAVTPDSAATTTAATVEAESGKQDACGVGNGAAPTTASPRAARKGGDKVDRMGTGSIPKLIVEFAIPSILGMLVNGAYNIIDSIFMGQAVGSIGLSTATTAMPLMTLFMALAMLVGNGGNALAALRMGQGDRGAAERCLGNTVTLGVIIWIVVIALTQTPVFMDAVLSISGATELDWDYSHSFIQILAVGFLFQIIGAGVNNFIRTAGAPTRALVTMIVGAVFCTLFNFLFVIVLGWGVAGSAWATVWGQFASCLCVLWYFLFTKSCPIKLRLSQMRPDWGTIRRILALGFASFVMQMGMAVVNLVLNNLLNMYGAMTPIGAEGAKASIGVVGRIAMFTVLPLIGVAIAIQPLEGYNYGARLFDRVRKTLWDGVIGATAIAILGFALVHIFPVQIISFFGITDPNLRDFTIFALQIQLMMLPFVGFQIVVSNYFQATGQPIKSIFLSLTRQILFLIPLYIVLPILLPVWFPQYTGLDALYFAVPVADFLAIFTALVFILVERKRLHKLESGELEVRI